MTMEDNKNFKNSIKCLTCDSDYFDNYVEVRGHGHINGK